MHVHSPRLFVFIIICAIISFSISQDAGVSFGGDVADPNDDYQSGFNTLGSDDMPDDLLQDPDDDFDMEDLNFEDFFTKGIADFDDDTLPDAVSQSGLVLVLFMNERYPEDNQDYEAFFKTLAPYLSPEAMGTEINLGRIMIMIEDSSELSDYYKPKQYPALVLFDHVRKFEYDDELELVEFFTWFTQIISREPIELQNQEDFDRFLESDSNPKLVAFYNSRDSQELEALHEIASRSYLVHFDIRKVAMCLEYCSAQYRDFTFNRPALVLFKNYESTKPYAILNTGLDNAEAVFAFANLEALPPVLIFDQVNHTKIFGEVIRTQLSLIIDPAVDNTQLLKEFTDSANHNRDREDQRSRVIHMVYNFDEKEEGLNWFFNTHDKSRLPRLFLVQTSESLDKITKYLYQRGEPITVNSIRQFRTDFQENRLERFYISEDVPNNVGNTAQKIVGSTFEREVLESPQNYMLFACPDMEKPQCSTALKNYQEALEGLINSDKTREANLKIGYIDIAKNEADIEHAEEYPVIFVYRARNKKLPTSYTGPFTHEELDTWVKHTLNELQTEGLLKKTAEGAQGSPYPGEL